MGKTKAANINQTAEKSLSGKEKYEAKKAAKEALQKGGSDASTKIDASSTKPTDSKKKVVRARSKKYVEARANVNRDMLYPMNEAISLVQKTSYSKFDGTVELHLTVKKEGLSANVILPHSTGKQKKVEFATEATLEKLKTGKVDFDVLLSTAEMMPKLVAFARILGPKGLMPNPKNGTIVKDEASASKFSSDTLSVKTEKKAPLVHTVCGKVSMKATDIEENINAILNALNRRQVLKASIKATMGPSVKLKLE